MGPDGCASNTASYSLHDVIHDDRISPEIQWHLDYVLPQTNLHICPPFLGLDK